jgi:alpha-ribazole phosphatase
VRWVWVRHGETEANVRGCYLGHLDSVLTARGYEQAEIVAERMLSVGATRLYTSDLGRCVETASIIARKLGLEIVMDSRLRELNFGQWEGRTYVEVMSMDQELLERWYDAPSDIAPPDGETLIQLGQRVVEWLLQTMDGLHPDDTVIVVSHGGPIRWFQSGWLLQDTSSYWKVDAVFPGNFVIADLGADGRRRV